MAQPRTLVRIGSGHESTDQSVTSLAVTQPATKFGPDVIGRFSDGHDGKLRILL